MRARLLWSALVCSVASLTIAGAVALVLTDQSLPIAKANAQLKLFWLLVVAAPLSLTLTALVYALLQALIGAPLLRTWLAATQAHTEVGAPTEPGRSELVQLATTVRWLVDTLASERRSAAEVELSLGRVKEALARSQTELVSQDRLAVTGRLAAGVAHEVGNPLSGILGYLSVVRAQLRSGRTDDTEAALERIEHEVQRIDHIVRALLELGRHARGGLEPVDVRAIVDAARSLLKSTPSFEAVDVHADVAEGTYVTASAGPLSQVLINLMINAAQSMNGKGRLWLRTVRDGEHLELIVEDEGAGLSPEARQRLFELFFTTKPAGQGTGLGLAVSKQLIEHMGGTIRAEDRDAGLRGARFVVRLTAV